jgi:hypothetical protein
VPTGVLLIWIVWLVAAFLALPVLANVLLRIVRAARKIAIYTRETNWASASAAENLQSLPLLNESGQLLERAKRSGVEAAAGAREVASIFERRAGERE